MITDINTLKARIDKLNAEAAEVNQQRTENNGKRDVLRKRVDSLLKAYTEKYGVTLTMENFSEVAATVTAEKETQANKLEEVLTALREGDYATANSLVGIELNAEEQVLNEQRGMERKAIEASMKQMASQQTLPQEAVESSQTASGSDPKPTPKISAGASEKPLDVSTGMSETDLLPRPKKKNLEGLNIVQTPVAENAAPVSGSKPVADDDMLLDGEPTPAPKPKKATAKPVVQADDDELLLDDEPTPAPAPKPKRTQAKPVVQSDDDITLDDDDAGMKPPAMDDFMDGFVGASEPVADKSGFTPPKTEVENGVPVASFEALYGAEPFDED